MLKQKFRVDLLIYYQYFYFIYTNFYTLNSRIKAIHLQRQNQIDILFIFCPPKKKKINKFRKQRFHESRYRPRKSIESCNKTNSSKRNTKLINPCNEFLRAKWLEKYMCLLLGAWPVSDIHL